MGCQQYNSLKLWRPLAKNGHAKAQNNLGIIYFNGQGVTQDYVNAHMWLSLSASNGSKHARESLKLVVETMTSAQISKAKYMASNCKKKKYKNCN